jgi:hypothetical protein
LVEEERFRRMLRDCRFPTRGQRPGFVPFRAPCLAARWAVHRRVTTGLALRELGKLARELGGELLEGEVLWLPERDFAEMWGSDQHA